ncbi:MAG: glycine betaine/L-proline ABC transporter ATP-binding protein, partial [Pseudomonadales bacterium]|nr:glycine betaine/L-proline ABC transporter ATP-binding protein [Pseudomonadales bacterium]
IADRIAIMDQGRIVQIGSPEDLVLNPANDYVARFVKNVPRSKVVRVSSIMRNATSADSVGDWAVNANDRLAEVAPRIGESTQSIAIQDDDGVTLGYIDRDKFVRVLAGVS